MEFPRSVPDPNLDDRGHNRFWGHQGLDLIIKFSVGMQQMNALLLFKILHFVFFENLTC